MLRKIAGLFLVAHAVAHAGLAAAPIPNDTESLPGAFSTSAARSWLLPRLGLGAASVRWVGIVFVALTALGFLVAGLGVLGVPGMRSIWRGATAVSAVSSLLLTLLFWHPWLAAGVPIDIAILAITFWPRGT